MASAIEERSPDTAWSIFWEVGYFVQLRKDGQIAIISGTAEGQTKPLTMGFVPLGPTLVKATWL
jgi:hypothetical protein